MNKSNIKNKDINKTDDFASDLLMRCCFYYTNNNNEQITTNQINYCIEKMVLAEKEIEKAEKIIANKNKDMTDQKWFQAQADVMQV